MAKGKNRLIQAFNEDHALLGSGFFELSMALRNDDIDSARIVAQRLNADAGAHIAFEEECFYPALAKACGYNIAPLNEEHRVGRNVVQKLCALEQGQTISADERLHLLTESGIMESHIAECGALFKAMERMPESQQDDLYNALMDWRRKCPTWLEFSAVPDTKEAPER